MSSDWMRVGAAVRHKIRADWGTGEIVSLDASKCVVRFGAGEKTLDRQRAATLLEPTAEPVPPPPAPPSKARPSGTGVKCAACDRALRSSIYREDEKWKSCPNCSGRQGSEHVLRRNPDEFGTTDHRVTDGSPDGVQSHCAACRVKEVPADSGRLCSSFR
jgi:hypothetical protein